MHVLIDGYVALYDYKAQDTDEVEFEEGDIFTNVQPLEGNEGWLDGTLMRTGRRGSIPGQFPTRARTSFPEPLCLPNKKNPPMLLEVTAHHPVRRQYPAVSARCGSAHLIFMLTRAILITLHTYLPIF